MKVQQVKPKSISIVRKPAQNFHRGSQGPAFHRGSQAPAFHRGSQAPAFHRGSQGPAFTA
jgi:transcription elongation factor